MPNGMNVLAVHKTDQTLEHVSLVKEAPVGDERAPQMVAGAFI
jgi:hypothetical protein